MPDGPTASNAGCHPAGSSARAGAPAGDRAVPAPGPHGPRLSAAQSGRSRRGAAPTPRPTPTAGPWDPGQIDDVTLAAAFRPAALARAREEFDRGLLVELVRGAKPERAVPLAAPHRAVPRARRHPLYALRLRRGAPLQARPARRLGVPDAGALRVGGPAIHAADGAPVPADLLDEIDAMLLEWIELGISAARGRGPTGWHGWRPVAWPTTSRGPPRCSATSPVSSIATWPTMPCSIRTGPPI